MAMESSSKHYPHSTHPNDGLSQYHSRDIVGYASNPPTAIWPNGAKVALNFVLNYEEGGENCVLHGDGESEKLLSEIVGAGAIGEIDRDVLVYLSKIFCSRWCRWLMYLFINFIY